MGWLEYIFAKAKCKEKAREPLGFFPPKRPINKVFIHCSASDNPAHDNIEIIRQWHYARGFNDVGYHYYINKNGVVYDGRDVELAPAAQSGFNRGTIAICVGGLESFTPESLEVLKDACIEIRDTYKRKGHVVTFHGHNEVNPHKTCPVFDYKEILKLDKQGNLGI